MKTTRYEKHQTNKKHEEINKSSSESDSSGEWVEASPAKQTESRSKPLQRESWMEMTHSFIPTTSKNEMRNKEQERKEEKRRAEAAEQMKLMEKALYRPSAEKNQRSDVVGDGGASWLRKAYRRMKEQSAETGCSMEELAANRYGSLQEFERMLEEAETKCHNQQKRGRDCRFRRPEDNYNYGRIERNREERFRKMEDHNPRERQTRGEDQRECNRQNSRSREKHADDKPRWMKRDSRRDESPKTQIAEGSTKTGPATVFDGVKKSGLQEGELLSEKEMNELGAKIVKAEIMGNQELVLRLKERLDACRAMAKEKEQEPRVVLLTQSTSGGLTRPLEASTSHGTASGKKKQKVATHDSSGKRVCYFGDDDKYSLREMFEREKFRTTDDDMTTYLKMAAKGRTNSDYDFDDLFVDKSCVEDSAAVRQRKDVQRAIWEDKQMSATLEKCHFCLDSRNMQKHLIVAMGTKSYLALPGLQSLAEGHCLVVPIAHVPSSTMLDEDVWTEMQEFRRSLHKLFRARDCDTIFMETSMNLRWQPHMCLECIPLPDSEGSLAPMYFKKAILESETEWAENKKLVDLSKRGIRHSVPKGLPFFSVDFGLDGGFAHVIEDEKLFPKYFGKEIVGGILDLEPQLWLKPKKEKFEEQSKKVLQFTRWWKSHDKPEDT